MLFGAIFAISAAVPGADTMLLFGRALGGGSRAAVPLAVGITLGKLVLLALAGAGVTAVATAYSSMFLLLKAGGAIYLAWLGLRMWRSDPASAADDPGSSDGKARVTRGIGTGFVLAISNPQAILFYVAVLPAVLGTTVSLALYLALAVTLCLVMSVVAAFYILVGAHTRRSAARRSSRLTNRVAGAMLVGAGAIVAMR